MPPQTSGEAPCITVLQPGSGLARGNTLACLHCTSISFWPAPAAHLVRSSSITIIRERVLTLAKKRPSASPLPETARGLPFSQDMDGRNGQQMGASSFAVPPGSLWHSYGGAACRDNQTVSGPYASDHHAGVPQRQARVPSSTPATHKRPRVSMSPLRRFPACAL